MIETDNLMFSNNFKDVNIKYTIPFIIISDIFCFGLFIKIIPHSVLSINLFGAPIIILLVLLGLLETLLILYKYFLKINITFFTYIPPLICLTVSCILFFISMLFWKQRAVQCFIFALSTLSTSPDRKFNNASLFENIIISVIRLFVFTVFFVYTLQFLYIYL